MDRNQLSPYCEQVLNGRSDKGYGKRRKEEIVKPEASLKNWPDLVFVVQFRDPTERGSARFTGRAEHLMSGQNTGFETPEGLVDFFGRVMNQLKPRSQKGVRQ
jgi:hypothetical protein